MSRRSSTRSARGDPCSSCVWTVKPSRSRVVAGRAPDAHRLDPDPAVGCGLGRCQADRAARCSRRRSAARSRRACGSPARTGVGAVGRLGRAIAVVVGRRVALGRSIAPSGGEDPLAERRAPRWGRSRSIAERTAAWSRVGVCTEMPESLNATTPTTTPGRLALDERLRRGLGGLHARRLRRRRPPCSRTRRRRARRVPSTARQLTSPAGRARATIANRRSPRRAGPPAGSAPRAARDRACRAAPRHRHRPHRQRRHAAGAAPLVDRRVERRSPTGIRTSRSEQRPARGRSCGRPAGGAGASPSGRSPGRDPRRSRASSASTPARANDAAISASRRPAASANRRRNPRSPVST